MPYSQAIKILYTIRFTRCRLVSEVISIRVPRELEEKMRRYNVDWSEEIRRFIEERIKTLELLEILDHIEKRTARRRVREDSAKLIREAREEH
jgi:hypothetical protein